MKRSESMGVPRLQLGSAFAVSSAEVIEQAAQALARDAARAVAANSSKKAKKRSRGGEKQSKPFKLSKYIFRKLWRYLGHLVSVKLEKCLAEDRGLFVPSLGLFSLDMMGSPT